MIFPLSQSLLTELNKKIFRNEHENEIELHHWQAVYGCGLRIWLYCGIIQLLQRIFESCAGFGRSVNKSLSTGIFLYQFVGG